MVGHMGEQRAGRSARTMRRCSVRRGTRARGVRGDMGRTGGTGWPLLTTAGARPPVPPPVSPSSLPGRRLMLLVKSWSSVQRGCPPPRGLAEVGQKGRLVGSLPHGGRCWTGGAVGAAGEVGCCGRCRAQPCVSVGGAQCVPCERRWPRGAGT